MTPSSHGPSSPGFFRTTQASLTTLAEAGHVVELGSASNNVFLAVAMLFLDRFLEKPRSIKTSLLATILAEHFDYFPSQRVNLPGLVTAAERMQHLIKHERLSELLHSLASTFQQLAVDELFTNAIRYPKLFLQGEPGVFSSMRQPSSCIDTKSALSAISRALDMSIELRITARLKTLPWRCCYHSAADQLSMVLQQENSNIKVYVASDIFSTIRPLPVRAIEPDLSHKSQDPSLQEIRALAMEESLRLSREFADTYNRLISGVLAGELTKAHLLDAYIKSFNEGERLSGSLTFVGSEHGHQALFEEIYAANLASFLKELPEGIDNDLPAIRELIHALARGVSFGEIDINKVYANIEAFRGTSAKAVLAGI
jgi:hypothetical protein